jgi:formate hydrogenlyase subunit 3/multisubunit Na+/H+ antiporter MnhD subunit
MVAGMIPMVRQGQAPQAILFTLVPGAELVLRADPLGLVFAALCSGLWLLTTAYSVGYVRALEEHAQTRYFCCFALCVGAAIGVALAGNLVTFFAFYELLTLATYPLVVHKETPAAIRVGRIYLAYTLGAGACLLGGLAWVHAVAGTTSFHPGGILPRQRPARRVGSVAPRARGGVPAAAPLHAWLAHAAPTPVRCCTRWPWSPPGCSASSG